MVFLILTVLVFLLIMVFKKYRSIYSVIGALILIAGITTAVLLWGRYICAQGSVLKFFNSEIGSREFYYLITAWYGADIMCAALIIRNLRAYKKINS
jgi:Mn2+/Fe2+ NRAMP family transporter